MMHNTKLIERGSLAILAVFIGCEMQEDNLSDGRMEATIPEHVIHELDAIAGEARARLAREDPTVEEIEAVLRGKADAAALFGMTDAEYAALGQRLIDASSSIDPAAVPLPPRSDPRQDAELLHAIVGSAQYKRWPTCRRWIAYGLCLAAVGVAAAPTANVPAYVLGGALCACKFCEIPSC